MNKEIKLKKEIKEYDSIKHIEIAAGYGDFGKKFYPECILSDKDEQCYNLNISIDLLCDATDIPFSNDRFNLIIICNPFNFGFKKVDDGVSLLKEFIRVLKDKGKILIIGNNANPWCKLERVEKTVQKLQAEESLKLSLKIDSAENNSFNPKVEYNNYIFYQTGGTNETKPNMRFTIYVTK